MADTYTSRLRLTMPEVGANDGVWETPFNDGFVTLADFAIAGEQAVSVTSGNVTLSTANGATDEARAMVIRATGTPGASRSITAPNVDKLYVVINQSDDEITFGPSGQTFLTIPQGYVVLVFCMADVAAIEIKQYGTGVTDPGANSSDTFDVKAGIGGSTVTTATFEYFVQGGFCYLNIAAWNGTFAFSGGTGLIALTMQSGYLPAAMLPSGRFYHTLDMWVDTGGGWAALPGKLEIPITGTYLLIDQLDGDLYADADIGIAGNIALCYPVNLQ